MKGKNWLYKFPLNRRLKKNYYVNFRTDYVGFEGRISWISCLVKVKLVLNFLISDEYLLFKTWLSLLKSNFLKYIYVLLVQLKFEIKFTIIFKHHDVPIIYSRIYNTNALVLYPSLVLSYMVSVEGWAVVSFLV